MSLWISVLYAELLISLSLVFDWSKYGSGSKLWGRLDDTSVWISMSYPVLSRSLSVLFDFSKKASGSGLLELENRQLMTSLYGFHIQVQLGSHCSNYRFHHFHSHCYVPGSVSAFLKALTSFLRRFIRIASFLWFSLDWSSFSNSILDSNYPLRLLLEEESNSIILLTAQLQPSFSSMDISFSCSRIMKGNHWSKILSRIRAIAKYVEVLYNVLLFYSIQRFYWTLQWIRESYANTSFNVL